MLSAEPSRPDAGPPATAFDALARTRWLAAVPASTLRGLADQAMLHRVPAGVRLFEEAETPAFAQLLISGAVELLATRGEEETLIELVRAVDLLLPAAVLSGQPYLVGGKVREDARVVLVPAEAFRVAVATDHALCLAVLACQAAQFRRQMRLAKSVRLRSAEQRVGCYLFGLAREAGASQTRLPLEKRLIASQLGMTRETLSRTLPSLARQGLRVSGDVLTIDDAAAAAAAFPFDPLIDGPEPITPLSPARSSP